MGLSPVGVGAGMDPREPACDLERERLEWCRLEGSCRKERVSFKRAISVQSCSTLDAGGEI